MKLVYDENYEEIRCHNGISETPVFYGQSGLPYCCGIVEIGEFINLNDKDVKILLKNKRGNFAVCTKFFRELLSDGLTYMINTNGVGFSKFLEEYFETPTGKSLFKKVKSFKNPNSGNTITIYISK